MKKEEKLESQIKHKSFLVINKYIPHLIGLFYIIYTLFLFIDLDFWIINYLANVSFLTWMYLYGTSIVFRFCYVHRLPLYYIMANNGITIIDYYIGIPISVYSLLLIHLVLVGMLIFGYSYYYVNYKLKKMRFIHRLGGECYPLKTEVKDTRTELLKLDDYVSSLGYTAGHELFSLNNNVWMEGTNDSDEVIAVILSNEDNHIEVTVSNGIIATITKEDGGINIEEDISSVRVVDNFGYWMPGDYLNSFIGEFIIT